MHNKILADKLGINQEERDEIDRIHKLLEKLVDRGNLGAFNQSVYNAIEEYEYQLQSLWGFPRDESKHTWKHQYKFKCEWVGKKFICKITKKVFEIPEDVVEKEFFSFGEGCFVDVGVLDGYYRLGGPIEEI